MAESQVPGGELTLESASGNRPPRPKARLVVAILAVATAFSSLLFAARSPDRRPVAVEGDIAPDARGATAMSPIYDPRSYLYNACLKANGFDQEAIYSAAGPATTVAIAPTATTAVPARLVAAPEPPPAAPNAVTVTGSPAQADPGVVASPGPPSGRPPTTTHPAPPAVSEGASEASPGWSPFELSPEQRAAAVKAARACKDFTPRSGMPPEFRSWYDCLAANGIAFEENLPIPPEPVTLEVARAADAACAAKRPAQAEKLSGEMARCMAEHGYIELPVPIIGVNAKAAFMACQHLQVAPPLPPEIAPYYECLAGAGLPLPARDRFSEEPVKSVDPAQARAAWEACKHLSPQSATGEGPGAFVTCMAEHGVIIELPVPVLWPADLQEQAAEACRGAMPRWPTELNGWMECLEANGINVAPRDSEPKPVALDVATRAIDACQDKAPDVASMGGGFATPEEQSQARAHEACLKEHGIHSYFPAPIEGADYEKAYRACGSLLPEPPVPEPLRAWRACLEENGLVLPPDGSAPDFDKARNALAACAALEPLDAGGGMSVGSAIAVPAPTTTAVSHNPPASR